MRPMLILVACEESQEITKAFRARGHKAFSCDIQPCSGGHPEWHIMGDCLPLLGGHCVIETQDGGKCWINMRWDLIIAHPPCTYLTVTGNRWFNVERYGEKAIKRAEEREKAAEFFMKFVEADCDRIAIENPVGVMGTRYRKADQIIQPYMFGDPARKSTCLWLKGLPKLEPTNIVEPEIYEYVRADGRIGTDSRWRSKGSKDGRAKMRSKTFKGIAEAIAEQWGKEIET